MDGGEPSVELSEQVERDRFAPRAAEDDVTFRPFSEGGWDVSPMPLRFGFGESHDHVGGFRVGVLEGGKRHIALAAEEHLDDVDRHALRFRRSEVNQQFAIAVGQAGALGPADDGDGRNGTRAGGHTGQNERPRGPSREPAPAQTGQSSRCDEQGDRHQRPDGPAIRFQPTFVHQHSSMAGKLAEGANRQERQLLERYGDLG